MAETQADITENSVGDTLGYDSLSLREWIAKHADHLDTGIHELQQALARVEQQVAEIHAELETARPLIERWQHSRIRKLAAGQMPWDHT